MSGLFFDELQVGHVFKHALRRTVTEADNVFFTALTHNPAQLHLDEEYCNENSPFGQRILNSGFTLALMTGVAGTDINMGTSAVGLGWDDIAFPKPIFHGDTLHFETEVISLNEDDTAPSKGKVVLVHRAYNQKDELVGSCKHTGLHPKSPDADS